MQLFSVVFCTVGAVPEFDCSLVINEMALRNVVTETDVFDRIYVFSPDHRREMWRDSTHAVQLNSFFLSKGLCTILQLFYWESKLFNP